MSITKPMGASTEFKKWGRLRGSAAALITYLAAVVAAAHPDAARATWFNFLPASNPVGSQAIGEVDFSGGLIVSGSFSVGGYTVTIPQSSTPGLPYLTTPDLPDPLSTNDGNGISGAGQMNLFFSIDSGTPTVQDYKLWYEYDTPGQELVGEGTGAWAAVSAPDAGVTFVMLLFSAIAIAVPARRMKPASD